ncbi:hypothetical protein HWV62_11970 [Athelia sp. TMB]|nr:hypothetical protein HWV62_11970 [Athelia sp. TMB]
MHYIVQDVRYNIWEDVGCATSTIAAALVVPLQDGWPFFIGLVTSVYCGLILHTCAKNYGEVRKYLNKMANRKQYIRLAILAILNFFATTGLSLWIIIVDSQNFEPWQGWAYVHSNWDVIGQLPYAVWGPYVLSQASRWFVPLCALMFFSFFGFADEVWAGYDRAFRAISSKVLTWAAPVRGRFSKSKAGDRPIIAIRRDHSDLPMYHPSQPTRHEMGSAFTPDRSYASFESSVSLGDKYPWVATSSVGTLPDTPLSIGDNHLPSRPAAAHRFSPEDSTQSFSSSKGLIPRF